MTIDQQTIVLAKAGNLQAFERIVTAFEKPIFSYAFRLTGNRQDAEDVAQDTFVKLYKRLGSIDLEKKFSAWLYQIATNTAYDLLRRRKYAVNVGLEEVSDEADETGVGEDPYHQAARQFDESIIQSHLMRLAPTQRTVILLYYYKGFSLEEIADMVKLPKNTVKTHLFRGRLALKKNIENIYE